MLWDLCSELPEPLVQLLLAAVQSYGLITALVLCLGGLLLVWVFLALRRRGLSYWLRTPAYVRLTVVVLGAAQCVSMACPEVSSFSPALVFGATASVGS